MRDYICVFSSGAVRNFSDLSTKQVHLLLDKANSGAVPCFNPGVTRQAITERLELELFIRENNLRGE